MPYCKEKPKEKLSPPSWGVVRDLSIKKRNEHLKLSETLRGKIREVKEFESELVKMASARPTFDLDDGVATNYPKFYPLVEPIKGLDAKED